MDAYTEALLSHPLRTRKGERRKTIESFLELLSAAIMEWHTSNNPSSYDFIRLHTSEAFETINMGMHDCSFPESCSLEAHLANVSKLKRLNPAWEVGGFNFTASIEDDSDAVVGFTSKGTGGPCEFNTNRESVSQLHWRKRNGDGAWECYKHVFIRGPGNYFYQKDESARLPKGLQ